MTQCEYAMDLSSVKEPLKAEVNVNRKAFDQVKFNERFQFELPTGKNVLEWLPKYRWHEDFVYDVAGGFTVAVMHIPQGMSYGILAGVDPIVGIYTAFFPILVYIIMGTSRHASFGSFALISILISGPVQKYGAEDANGDELDYNYSKAEVLAAISFTVGLFQVLGSIFQVGQFCALLSDAMISGFTTGTAFFVFTSQLEHILGIDLPRFLGPFNLIKFYHALVFEIHKTNLMTLSLSVSCITLLLIYDLWLKKHVKRCLRGIEFPIQLVFVIIAILISYFGNLHEDFGVKIIGHVPTGFPSPVRLPINLIPKVAMDSAIIAIVAFVISFSLGRIFGKKQNYKVPPSQELIAQGCSCMFGAFFNSMPIAASLSRSAIQEESGSRTLMATAVSCFALLWVLLYAGPLFQPLPKAVLAAIIVVALRSMFLKVTEVVSFARKSTFDGLIWLLAFFSTVILDVNYGLLVTFTANVLSVLHSSLTPTVQVLSETDYPDLNIDPDCYHYVVESSDCMIIKIAGKLCFANANKLEDSIEATIDQQTFEQKSSRKPRFLLLEMSGVLEMDPSAWHILKDVHKVLIKNKQTLVISGLQGNLWGQLNIMDIFDDIPVTHFFPTLQDALSVIHEKRK